MVAAYPSNYLLLVLVIVVGTASVAQANFTIGATITIGGVNVSGVVVNGVFAFSANPTIGVAAIGVAGVNITLSCDGGNTTIGTSAFINGSTGAFKVATTTGNGTLFQENKCAVYASIVTQADATASVSLSAPLESLTIQTGVELEVVNGQIEIIADVGSSIATYVTGTFEPVA